jgi:hypothetical protein
MEAIIVVEGDLQKIDAGDDEEVAYFPGAADPRTSEDNKWLKLGSRGVRVGIAGSWVA